MPTFNFKKDERLKSRTLINSLFERDTSKSFGNYPLRIVWVEVEEGMESPAQFTMTVPKRAFRKAAHRNRLRRQIRESYRLHKHVLYDGLVHKDKRLALMFIYTAKEVLPYASIEAAVKKIIHRLLKKL